MDNLVLQARPAFPVHKARLDHKVHKVRTEIFRVSTSF